MSEGSENAIFMVEGGQALLLVRQHVADRQRVNEEVNALCRELGVERASTSRDDGRLLGVVFSGARHPDFKAPDRRGVSYPKRGTEWHRRFAAQKGYPNPEQVIANAFRIPLQVHYRTDGGEGYRCIGHMLTACGWLYLSADGPYAMWVPDVPAEVAAEEARGHTVEEPAKSFRLEFDGCRRIEREEWEILVAQHKLQKKREAVAA